MQKEILYGVLGLLLGVVVTGYAASNAVNSNNQGIMNMMGIHQQTAKDNPATSGSGMMHNMSDMMDNSMTMNAMVNSLKGKTGDDFDKAFLFGMVEHHQGAIDMANEAKKNAKHEEIKTMADDIISTQSKEIGQMKQWQKDWGYTTESNENQ